MKYFSRKSFPSIFLEANEIKFPFIVKLLRNPIFTLARATLNPHFGNLTRKVFHVFKNNFTIIYSENGWDFSSKRQSRRKPKRAGIKHAMNGTHSTFFLIPSMKIASIYIWCLLSEKRVEIHLFSLFSSFDIW